MRMLGVKNWKKAALNREEWAKLLKQARAVEPMMKIRLRFSTFTKRQAFLRMQNLKLH
jgi:hypothetical protein